MRYAAIGTELAGSVVVPIILGIGWDQWQGTTPWGLLVGVGLGLLMGLLSLTKLVIRVRREMEDGTSSETKES